MNYEAVYRPAPATPGLLIICRSQSCNFRDKTEVEEVSMNENCHRTKSFCSVTLPYRCNVSQVSQKWISIFVTLGLHRNYIYKEEQKQFVL